MTDQRVAGNSAGHASDSGAPASSAGQDWLCQLDWRQFEELVGAAYRLQGYTVLPTSPGADGGIDLILTRDDERIFVQCKHWKAWQVGAPVIRELYGLVAANRATRGIVITSGTFSREAIEFARQTGTELLDGPAVLALVASGNAHGPVGTAQAFGQSQPPPTSFAPPSGAPAGAPSCPVCLSPMVLHKARRGPQAGTLFWGCTRYPGCRGTREAAPGTRLLPTPSQLARQRRNRHQLIVGLVAMVLGLLLLPISVGVLGSMIRASTSPTHLVSPAPSIRQSTPAKSGVDQLGEQPMDLAVGASGKRLYTANYISGDVTVIDTHKVTVVGTIDVPGKPDGIDIAGSTIYVADYSGRKVYAIDVRSRHVVATYKAGRGAAGVAVDPGAHRLFVLNSEDKTIWSYDLRTHRRVGTLKSYGATSIAVDTAEHKLYTLMPLGLLCTYRTTNLTRLRDTYIGEANAIAVDSQRQRLYLIGSSGLRERNLMTGKSRSIDIEPGAQSIAVDPSARKAYLADPDTDAVQSVNLG